MARTANPDSATSQFYINLVDNSRGLDPRPGSAGYAVFGRVTSGTEVVDAIAQVPTARRRGGAGVGRRGPPAPPRPPAGGDGGRPDEAGLHQECPAEGQVLTDFSAAGA